MKIRYIGSTSVRIGTQPLSTGDVAEVEDSFGKALCASPNWEAVDKKKAKKADKVEKGE